VATPPTQRSRQQGAFSLPFYLRATFAPRASSAQRQLSLIRRNQQGTQVLVEISHDRSKSQRVAGLFSFVALHCRCGKSLACFNGWQRCLVLTRSKSRPHGQLYKRMRASEFPYVLVPRSCLAKRSFVMRKVSWDYQVKLRTLTDRECDRNDRLCERDCCRELVELEADGPDRPAQSIWADAMVQLDAPLAISS
jgi:hypothetical protein